MDMKLHGWIKNKAMNKETVQLFHKNQIEF